MFILPVTVYQFNENTKIMKIGDTFYRMVGGGEHMKYHVVHLFTDDDNEVITLKYWSKRFRMWRFETEYVDEFNSKLELGLYKLS